MEMMQIKCGRRGELHWEEFFGAEQKLDLKDRMRASGKEVQKLSADAKMALGSGGGPSYGAAAYRSRSSRRDARAGSATGGDRSFPPGFVKPAANVPGEQLGIRRIQCVLSARRKGILHGSAPTNRAAVRPPGGA